MSLADLWCLALPPSLLLALTGEFLVEDGLDLQKVASGDDLVPTFFLEEHLKLD